MRKVFISYARPDIKDARRIFKKLKSVEGLEPWFDEESLPLGMKWRTAVRKEIRESDVFLAVISSNTSDRRGYQNTELDEAIEILKEFPEGQTFVIPVRLDECQPPRVELSDLNWVDLFPNWNLGLNRLLANLTPSVGINRVDSKPDMQTLDYQFRVGLVDLDLGLTNLQELAQQLNRAQKFFLFTCPTLPSVKKAVREIDGLTNLAVFKIPASFYEEHPNLAIDLVACLTRYPLAFEEDDELLSNYFAGPSDDDERFMFISTDQLYGFSKEAGRSFEEGLVQVLVGQLVCFFTDVGYHEEIRSCVMDFCQLRANQIKGLRSRRFCKECAKELPTGSLRTAIDTMLSWDSSKGLADTGHA